MPEEIENEVEEVIEEVEELSIEDEMRAALQEPQDEAEKPEVVEEPTPEPVVDETPPPASLSGAIKEKWKDLPADVKAEWSKRENDFHQAMTRHDGELNLGRKMKEVINPYMPIIQAEGGTPETAVRDLLNTAYVLRTGSPAQKAEIIRTVAQQYNVDLNQAVQPREEVHPVIAQLQQQIADLQTKANPEAIRNQLQSELESANIQEQIKAFASDASNIHFESVKAPMAALLDSGQAQTMKEAYDAACWANPTIRASLLKEQQSQLEAKRKEEIKAKKQASASISGSPELTSPANRANQISLEDELLTQIREASGQIT